MRGMLAGVNETAPPATSLNDEVSLRELFLILKRGLGFVMLVTLASVAVAVAWSLLTPARYVAEATIVSSPNQITLQEGQEGVTLGFDVRSVVDAATFESLATSRATFEATLNELAGTPGAPERAEQLTSAASIASLAGSGGGTALTMALRMEHPDPDVAAAWANAWTLVTVERVRAALLDDLGPIFEQTTRALEERAATLRAAESSYEAVLARDLPGLQQRLAAANARVDWLVSDLATVDRTLAGLQAEAAALPAGPGEERTRLTRDVARVEGERSAVSVTLEAERAALDALRAEVAAADVAARTAQRTLEDAQEAYRLVANAQPVLELVSNLTPKNTRVLDAAQPPSTPSDVSLLLVAALAGVIGALTSVLLVFLREAVRDPAASPTS